MNGLGVRTSILTTVTPTGSLQSSSRTARSVHVSSEAV
jgi:hypothetical protein